ncbi:MAG TPA: polyprenyl diphosphate synthase [Xanthomonadales bacterium]|nr:polyprenyl diphosphate synthase [Xanthomonadales bacterium]
MNETAPTPAPPARPRHIAIVMDGNGRWAKQRNRPRTFGHRAGAKAVRATVEACLREKIEALTLFAFSSENWKRPESEVSALMKLFLNALDREVEELAGYGVRLRFIGERAAFAPELIERMDRAERRTEGNATLAMNVAVNYGGRMDIAQAARRLASLAARGELDPGAIDEAAVAAQLALAGQPEPDLFIRTGGEQRISNFLLWQLAYAELWFTDVLWPDFDVACLQRAIADFGARERRFGMTGEQVRAGTGRG